MQWAALQGAVASWANRSDLSSNMATFLTLAEDRIYSGDPVNNVDPLRVAEMLQTATLTPASGVITMPAGALEIKRVRDAASRSVLTPVDETKLGDREGDTAGTPGAYTMRAGKLIVAPGVSTAGLEVLYFGRLATPAAGTDENAIMARYPAIYLHAMLIEVSIYLQDDEMTARATRAFVSAVTGAQRADDRAEVAGLSQMCIRPDSGGAV